MAIAIGFLFVVQLLFVFAFPFFFCIFAVSEVPVWSDARTD